jgi:uncharacterized lipoprotein YajG
MKNFTLALVVLLSGCASTTQSVKYPDKTTVVTQKCKCPTFDRRLSIEVKDYNSEYGLISWEDVSKIEHYIAAKKRFNKNVDLLNQQK